MGKKQKKNNMSWSVSSPMFPSLTPRATDPLWFTVDKPVDEEAELVRMEAEHTQALEKIAKQGSDLTPIGKTDNDEEDEDDDSESDHDDEDEEDVDMANNFNQEDNV